MWIRLLLQPWWIRAAFWIGWVLIWVTAFVSYLRWDFGGNANPFTLPVPVVALIAAGCIVIGALCTALEASRRARYMRALDSTVTLGQRSQAISAAFHGPVPENPQVRAAARRVTELQLVTYRKNPQTYRVIYPLLAVVWVVVFGLGMRDPAPRMAFNGFQAALWITLAVWFRLAWRRLENRVELLAGPLDPQ